MLFSCGASAGTVLDRFCGFLPPYLAPMAPKRTRIRHSKAPIRHVKGRAKPWLLDLRSFGGTREFFKTEDLAKAARLEKVQAIHLDGVSSVTLSNAERMEFVAARDRLRKLNLTITQAVDFCERHHAQTKAIGIGDAIEELCALKEATNKRTRSVRNFRYTLVGMSASIGEKLVSEITRADIEKWLFHNDYAPATIRTKLIDARTFFRAGLARGWLTADPTAAIEEITLDNKPPGILTVVQASALMHACRAVCPEFCGWFALALFGGIRPEELEKMSEKNVQLERGYAEVPAEIAKTRQRRLVALSDNCKAWIGIGLELPPTNWRGRQNKVRLAAGFAGAKRTLKNDKEIWVPVPGTEWPHDCLRHSFASYHLAKHQSAEQTALQMGHRSTDMLFRHYRELVTKEEAEKFWAIAPCRRTNC